jgi:hypothetical protein
MHGTFAPLPYSGNLLSIHGNTSTADYDSMSFFCSEPLNNYLSSLCKSFVVQSNIKDIVFLNLFTDVNLWLECLLACPLWLVLWPRVVR